MREVLKKARQDAGLTQQQMADKLGISERHYQYLESGARLGKIETWDKLEDLTGVHQRILRENHGREDSQGKPQINQQGR